MHAIDQRIAELAARSHGLVRRADAVAAGVRPDALDRRVAAGVLERVARGIFHHTAFPRTWRGRVLAAVWQAGSAAVASHATAAALHGLDGAHPGVIEVSVPHGRHVTINGVRVHRRRVPLGDGDRVEIDGIPCTGLVATMVDLAWWRGLGRAEQSLDGAQRESAITDVAALHRDVEQRRGRGRTRVGKFSDTIAQRSGHQPTTVLERRFLRLIRNAGLPEPQCQVRITLANGVVVHVDFAFVDDGVIAETDGRRGHASDAERQRDHERDAMLSDLGWVVRRFTYRDITERPWYVVERIRSAIEANRRARHRRNAGE